MWRNLALEASLLRIKVTGSGVDQQSVSVDLVLNPVLGCLMIEHIGTDVSKLLQELGDLHLDVVDGDNLVGGH